MILTTVDNKTSLLREIKEINFFSVVVDEFDLVATKVIIKQLKGQFNVGLTTRNFLVSREANRIMLFVAFLQ